MKSRHGKTSRKRPSASTRKLRLEPLEDRRVLASITAVYTADISAEARTGFDAAMSWWEELLPANEIDLTINVEEANLGGANEAALATYSTKDANGYVETALIEFNENATFFYDPTPLQSSEFDLQAQFAKTNPTATSEINVGLSGSATDTVAQGKWDFFSVALHEIGHALGLGQNAGDPAQYVLYDNEITDGDIDIDATFNGLFQGGVLPITSIPVDQSHFDGGVTAFNDALLADPGFGQGERALPSDLDVLAVGSVYDLAINDVSPPSTKLVDALNAGLQAVYDAIVDVFSPSPNLRIAGAGLDLDIPIIGESLDEIAQAFERLSAPFDSTLSQVVDLDFIEQQLVGLGFDVEYLSLIPESSSGDILRVRYQQTFGQETPFISFDDKTGFEYFDGGVDGTLEGTLNATLAPVELDVTLGLDLDDNNLPRFFVRESSSLDIGGLSISGNVDANLGIRNLLDVDVAGAVTASLSGGISFLDGDADDKLRLTQFANIGSILVEDLDGSFNFDPTFTANLPIVGSLEWDGSWDATINDGLLDIATPVLDAPSIETVEQLLRNGYQVVAGAFDLFGGKDLGESLPGVDSGLGDILGLPEILTGGGVGETGFELNITAQTVLDLINGNAVDLIRFESSGGDSFSNEFSVPLAAAAIPIGPVPLTVTLAFSTEVEAGWSYYVGLGVDTSGFYIDPATMVSASGSIEAGLSGTVSVAGIAGMTVTAGLGAGLSMAVGLNDPDPADGRIYLDELINYQQAGIGDSLLNALKLEVSGEAYVFAKGVVELLFWDWTVFDVNSPLASFDAKLSPGNQSPTVNTMSQRVVTGRSPLVSGELDGSLLQSGVLTIDTRLPAFADRNNVVSIEAADFGSTEVTWRGVGQRTYAPGEIQSIVYLGNELDDRFFVGNGVSIPVQASGNGGRDVLKVKDAPAVLNGGSGDDMLTGGSAIDTINGGDGNDWLVGGGGNDTINGELGNDRLEGEEGDDTLNGGDGRDVILGGRDDDTLDGGDGDDILEGGRDDDTLRGGEGNDFMKGEEGVDTLYGDAGNDIITGGSGGDMLYGGLGDDALFGDSGYVDTIGEGNDFLYGEEGDDRLFGEGGNDVLEGDNAGTAGNDLLIGDGGVDTLLGGAGDDELLGGEGDDSLHGGDGDDVLNGQQGSDTLFGDAGEDTLRLDFAGDDGNTFDALSGGLDRDQLAVTGTVLESIVDGQPVLDSNVDDHIRLVQFGNGDFIAENLDPTTGAVLQQLVFNLDVSINGDIEQLTLEGLGGDDVLEVDTGPLAGKNIVLDGGEGDDILRGGDGRDTLFGGEGDDELFGGANDDVLNGDEGRDELDGGTGNDIMNAGAGDDLVLGGSEREIIQGGDGDDYLIAGTSYFGSSIFGGAGNDTIIGGPGEDLLRGQGGDDVILGGELNDTLIGGEGNDVLVGELGRDVVLGDAGHDTLFAYLNNTLRAELGLPLLVELTPAERSERRDRFETLRVPLVAERTMLKNIPENELTAAQEARLVDVANLITLYSVWINDLVEIQGVTIDRLNGGTGDDIIHGSPFPDELTGGDGDDNFYAGSNFPNPYLSDFINGDGPTFGGSDTIWFDGTAGADQIAVFTELDLFTGNRNAAVDLDGDGLSDGVVTQLTIESIGVRTFDGDDVINVDFGNFAAVANVVVDGGAGDDVVSAPLLQSRLIANGGAGRDLLIGGLNDDRLNGDGGDDDLRGGPGNDTLDGGAGDDLLNGSEGHDTLQGGLGYDTLIAGMGDDSLFGGDGEDLLQGNEGSDILDGGPGNDQIDTGSTSNPAIDSIVASRLGEQDTTIGSFNRIDPSQPVGGEQLVNSITAGDQTRPAMAVARDGSYVVTWHSDDGDGLGVFARRFSPSGVPLGDDFRVNVSTAGQQRDPTIGIADDGSFVIAWKVLDAFFAAEAEVNAQRFTPAGLRRGGVIAVNTDVQGDYTEDVEPKIAVAGDGSFVVAWIHTSILGDETLFERVFTSGGTPVLDQLTVHSFRTNSVNNAIDVAINEDGTFMVTWSDDDPGLGLRVVYARRFAASGAVLGNSFNVSNGRFERQDSPSIDSLSGGGYIIVWDRDGPTGNVGDTDIYGRRYDASGNQLDFFPFLINNTPSPNFLRRPSVAASPDGGFMATWLSRTGSDRRILGQRFSASNDPVGSELDLGPNTGALHTVSPAGFAENGDLVVAYQNSGGDSSGTSIHAQIFNAATAIPTAEQAIATGLVKTIGFSEPLATEGLGAVTQLSNWRLQRANGVEVTSSIGDISQAIDPVTQQARVSLSFAEPLPPGDYQLTAFGTITDSTGGGIDGNGDGVSGDNYVERFTVAASPLTLGNSVAVETSTAADNLDSQIIAVNPIDQGYVLVWEGPGAGAGETDIYHRRYDALGAPLGATIRVNTFTGDDQTDAAIAMDANGNYVIVWDTVGPAAAGHVTYGRRFAADGTPLANQFPINTTPTSESTRPSIAVEANGDFVVAWESGEVYAQRFTSAGGATGPQIHLNSQSTSGVQTRPALAIDGDGNFIAVWNSTVGGETTTVARWFSDTGIGEDEFTVSSNVLETAAPRIDMNPFGEFVVVWSNQVLFESLISRWTFETSPPNDLLNSSNSFTIPADSGPGDATGFHNSSSTDWTTPTGNGSANSFAANNWNVGDYFQFETSSVGFSSIVVKWDQQRDTGPRQFSLRYSTDNVNYTEAHTYGANGNAWELFRPRPSSIEVDLSSITALNDDSSIYFRIVALQSGTSANDRVYIDNFTVRGLSPSDQPELIARRYDSERRPVGGEFFVSHSSSDSAQTDADVGIDRNGNVAFSWIDEDGLQRRWLDASSNQLIDELDPLSTTATTSAIGTTPDGEFFVAWNESTSGGSSLHTQRLTLLPPTVIDAIVSPDSDAFVVSFSQPMATSGVGSVLDPANWALQLSDGRYLTQADSNLPVADPRATFEQFGAITYGFNESTGFWEATLPLNVTLPSGLVQLTARGSLRDAAGRGLDGNADGVPSENFSIDIDVFTIPGLDGDFDDNDILDDADIDALIDNIEFGPANPLVFDLTGDGLIDLSDLDEWLVIAGANNLSSQVPYRMGDVNLDGNIDSTDLGVLLNNFSDTSGLGWAGANFNPDSNVDSADLGLLLNNFGHSSAAATSAFALPDSSQDSPSPSNRINAIDAGELSLLDVLSAQTVLPTGSPNAGHVERDVIAAILVDENGEGEVPSFDALNVINEFHRNTRLASLSPANSDTESAEESDEELVTHLQLLDDIFANI